MRIGKIFVALLAVPMLAGCISGKPSVEGYTSPGGKTTVIESDREQCVSACNADDSRCMDTQAARTSPVAGSSSGMFGASADCRASLQNCLRGCKGR